jgi:hypothetical protein
LAYAPPLSERRPNGEAALKWASANNCVDFKSDDRSLINCCAICVDVQFRPQCRSLRSCDEIATEVSDDRWGEDAMASAVEHGDGASRFDMGIAPRHAMYKLRIAAALRTAGLCLWCLLLPVAFGRAQSLPPDATSIVTADPAPGLLPPYEINKIARAAGFSPLAAPRREGAVYVLRAIDRYDILIRIVVDARSGAIRAVNRLVSVKPIEAIGTLPVSDSGAGADSAVSGSPANDVMLNSLVREAPSSGQPRPAPQANDATPARTVPADIGGAPIGAAEMDVGTLPPPMTPSGTHSAFQGAPPLPRPRPPSVLKTEKAKPVPKQHTAKPNGLPAAASVFSVVPSSAPTTARKPSQIASPH